MFQSYLTGHLVKESDLKTLRWLSNIQDTQRTFEYLGTQNEIDIWALAEHSTLGYSEDTRHLGTRRALGGHLGTKVFKEFGT